MYLIVGCLTFSYGTSSVHITFHSTLQETVPISWEQMAKTHLWHISKLTLDTLRPLSTLIQNDPQGVELQRNIWECTNVYVFFGSGFNSSNTSRSDYIFLKVTRVAQWLERRLKGLMILTSRVESHCGTWVPAFQMRPYKLRSHVAVGLARKRILTTKSHEC
jgi:hypothetical protein